MGSPFRNVQKMKFEKANRERYDKMPQRVKDSLQAEAWKYGGPFWSPKHQVNVDPEDGVLYNRPIYQDGTMLTYPSLSKPTSRETEINKPPTPLNKSNDTIYRYNGKQVNKRFVDSIDIRDRISEKFLSGAMREGNMEEAKKLAKERPGGGKPTTLTKELDGKIIESRKWSGINRDSNEPRKTTTGKGRNFRTTEEGAGMTEKGVKEYKKKNPGSNLQTAVTGDVKPGSKAAKRRKSFCARSKGWTGERGRAARARWKCND